MFVLIFYITSVRNISHSETNLARYYHKCSHVVLQNVRNSCRILTKLEISRQFFEKYSNIKLHENPSSGIRFFFRAEETQTYIVKLIVVLAIVPTRLLLVYA
jgi:hypothetical protein